MFGGDSMIVIEELGTIRENLDGTPEDRESRELMEAMAISLSLAPLGEESRPVARSKPPPPLPPVTGRPSPPDEEPAIHARRNALNRLPAIFPPVGHEWDRSAVANAAQRRRAPPRPRWRRQHRVFAPRPESFAFPPPPGPGYQRLRRRRGKPDRVTFDSNTETEESLDEAPSMISTDTSYRCPYEPWGEMP